MKKILLAASLALVFVACKKDKDEEPAQVTPTVANLTGSFKMTGMTMNGVNVFDNSNSSVNFFDPCQRDDIHRLNSNMTYDYVDAGAACSPNGSYSDTWALPNSTTLVLDGESATIKSYNGSTLVLTGTDSGVTIEVTYAKQ